MLKILFRNIQFSHSSGSFINVIWTWNYFKIFSQKSQNELTKYINYDYETMYCTAICFNTIYNKFNYANFSFMIWLKQFFSSDFISTLSNKFELLFSYTIEKNHFTEKKNNFIEKKKTFHREEKHFVEKKTRWTW